MPFRYRLVYDDLPGNRAGEAIFVLNIIKLDNSLSGWNILYTLTHEIVHLKYNTASEPFVEFEAFRLLYESNVDILVQRAKHFAYEQCTQQGWCNTEYDISGYVYDYLIEKGEIENKKEKIKKLPYSFTA